MAQSRKGLLCRCGGLIHQGTVGTVSGAPGVWDPTAWISTGSTGLVDVVTGAGGAGLTGTPNGSAEEGFLAGFSKTGGGVIPKGCPGLRVLGHWNFGGADNATPLCLMITFLGSLGSIWSRS